MGRAPCCDKAKVKKGPWSPEEDAKLKEYINKYGTGGNWIALPAKAGLKRCGKSCRLRWLNYLRPNIKHGEFTDDEDVIICSLFSKIGSRWSIIAAHLPGRTDNDIKNYWNTKLKKKLMGISPSKRKNTTTTSQQQMQLPWLPSYLHVRNPKSQGSSNHSTRSNPFLTNIQSYPISSDFFSSFTTNTIPLQDNSTLLMVGGDQPSCSSSDGSFNQMITNVKEIEYNNYMGSTVGEEQMIMMSFNSLLNSDLSTVAGGEYQKLLFNSGPSHEIEKGNLGLLEDQVGFEDVVKLMFPNQSNRYDNLFLDDPSNDMIRSSNSCKNQERTMYYY